MKMILIGFMGAGKTSVAKELGTRLHLPVIDMDELVMRKTDSKNMHEVFAKGGELLVRETEIAIAKECAILKEGIIATGGGCVLNKIIFDYLRQSKDKITFLNASFQTLCNRLLNDDDRPLFTNQKEAQALYDFRQPLYLHYADHMIDVNQQSVAEVAAEIAHFMHTQKTVEKTHG
jgi:shikimate kinase